ncbi:MAG: YcxB family protein [Crocinitomicaceae bacterium]
MIFSFKIEQKDFLEFQLYTVSQSINVLKTRQRGRIITTLAAFLLTINLFVTGSQIAGLVMLVVAIFTYIFYPRFHRWRLKLHFTKYSKKNYGNHFGQDEVLEIHSNYIISKNIAGEGKVLASELDLLTEIPDYYFLKMKNGSSIILPKRDIQEGEKLKKELKKLGVPLQQQLNWVY